MLGLSLGCLFVGQDGILRRSGTPPSGATMMSVGKRVANPLQDAILPYITAETSGRVWGIRLNGCQ
jgi:hypothetical protein